MQECNYAEAQELDARWRIKERVMMKRHLQERIQLLSKQADKKLKLMVAKRNLPQLTDQEVAAIKLQLNSQMNLESWQEVNCTLIGKQYKEDKNEFKLKLWTDPKELISTRNGDFNTTSTTGKEAPGIRPELVPGDGQQPLLQDKQGRVWGHHGDLQGQCPAESLVWTQQLGGRTFLCAGFRLKQQQLRGYISLNRDLANTRKHGTHSM